MPKEYVRFVEYLVEWLSDGQPVSQALISKEEVPFLQELSLLSAKPTVIACNVDDEHVRR